jgi:hypothetical protein
MKPGFVQGLGKSRKSALALEVRKAVFLILFKDRAGI